MPCQAGKTSLTLRCLLVLAQVGCIGVGTLFQTNTWQVLPLCCPTQQPQPQALPPPHLNLKSFNNHVLFPGARTWSKKRDAPRHLDHMINLDLDIDLDHMINKLKMTKPNIYSSAQTCSLPPQNSTHEAFLIISSGKSKLN